MIPAGVLVATCPVHGPQPFERHEKNQWSYCSAGIAECQSVIPDELVTPDGGDVVQWFEYRRTRWQHRNERWERS